VACSRFLDDPSYHCISLVLQNAQLVMVRSLQVPRTPSNASCNSSNSSSSAASRPPSEADLDMENADIHPPTAMVQTTMPPQETYIPSEEELLDDEFVATALPEGKIT